MKPWGNFTRCHARLPDGQVQRRLGGSLRGQWNRIAVRPFRRCTGKTRLAADTTRDGLLQAISRLLQGVGHIATLGDGFWNVGKSNNKSAILLVRREQSGIYKTAHRSCLLEVGARQAKLGQHGMQDPSIQFILRIPNSRQPGTKVRLPVASLAAFGDEFNLQTTLPSKPSDSADELAAGHRKQYWMGGPAKVKYELLLEGGNMRAL